jgi:hypothetical protein
MQLTTLLGLGCGDPTLNCERIEDPEMSANANTMF